MEIQIADNLFIASACNKTAQAVAINSDTETAVFCTANSLRIGNAYLNGHSKPTTCVLFISASMMVSASEDSKLIVWKLIDGQWIIHATLVGHSSGIVAIAVSAIDNIICSSDSSAKIIVWSLKTLEIIQEITHARHHFLTMSLSHLPNSSGTTNY